MLPEYSLLDNPARYLFFTGKGGVGKTSLATATALVLADRGKSVLLVSTDPASNLDEILGVELSNTAIPVPGASGLELLNIDPEIAAEAYRERVLAQLGVNATAAELSTVREELSGACTTEIAAFDEFATLLAGGAEAYDHIIFDTAPTGHTLRLLSLPKAWTGFLEANERGASCLGPHSGLKMEESRFRAALETLVDAENTTVVLVTRPEVSAISEAARTSDDLLTLGLINQRLAVNGVFQASDPNDQIAVSIERYGKEALAHLPEALTKLPRDEVPLRTFDVVGLDALRALLSADVGHSTSPAPAPLVGPDIPAAQNLCQLADALVKDGPRLIMVMGKGGVGKTTIAAALAVGLVERGESVHLSTTDPAAHLTVTLTGDLPRLTVSRIDPKAETQQYIDKMMARAADLDPQERALLLEDLRSPCTEEVAVFHAFAHIVQEARSTFVVLDTAPTGHTLLLMDATGAYHRQVTRGFDAEAKLRIVTPLMHLQDPGYTRIILVTLPETTPVSQASALQNDLRRAKIEPYAWVINRSVLAAGTNDPLLTARVQNERKQIRRIAEDRLAGRTFIVPWLETPPVGLDQLSHLVANVDIEPMELGNELL
jgi:arsenite-transporting ATPase